MRISEGSSDLCSSDLESKTCSQSGGRRGYSRHPRQRQAAIRRLESASQTFDPAGFSTVFPGRLTLLGEGRHALFLILEGEGGVEHPTLELDTLGQGGLVGAIDRLLRSEEHTSELQSLMRISYAV